MQNSQEMRAYSASPTWGIVDMGPIMKQSLKSSTCDGVQERERIK
jgi:hypothetical protein